MIDEIRERVGAALSKRRGIEFDADELRTLVQVGFETWLISASQAEAALAKEARRPLDKPAYSPATLAERWGVSVGSIYRAIKAGELPAFCLGETLYRIRHDDVERHENGD